MKNMGWSFHELCEIPESEYLKFLRIWSLEVKEEAKEREDRKKYGN